MIYGYCRVSTADQASSEKTSLAEQERRIRAWASMESASPEIRIFIDPGVSGSIPLERRPAGIKMLASLKNGDTIVAVKLDRLFRSASDALSSVERMHEDGINVILLDVSAEPVASGGTGKLFFGMLAICAEFERGRIIERMAEGRAAKIAKGGYTGGHAPYGFRAVGKGSHAIIAEFEREQQVVNLIHDLKSDGGRSTNSIAKELRRRGITNRKGNPIGYEQVRRIIMRGRPVSEAAE